MQWSFSLKEFQRNLNAIVILNSNTDLGNNSNSNILISKVIIIVLCIVIDPMSDLELVHVINCLFRIKRYKIVRSYAKWLNKECLLNITNYRLVILALVFDIDYHKSYALCIHVHV